MTIEVEYYETDCEKPCTPNGCMGHSTDIPEIIIINGFRLCMAQDFSDWLYEGCKNGDLQKWKEMVADLSQKQEST